MPSPLAKIRSLGSARNGTKVFIAQRLTGIALVPLLIWLILSITSLLYYTDFGYLSVSNWVRTPHVTVFLILTMSILFYHSFIGLREILEDYVPNHTIKIISIILVEFFIITMTVASIFAILRVALGDQ